MLNKKINAFSLVEVGIVLIVVGILYTAVFSGKDFIDIAKSQNTSNQIHKIKYAVQQYMERYSAVPGDDKGAKRFGERIPTGNHDGHLSESEMKAFWIHLHEAGLIESSEKPSSKFGGFFSVKKDSDQQYWLILSESEGKALLSPKQAVSIKAKLGYNNDDVIIANGEGSTKLYYSGRHH